MTYSSQMPCTLTLSYHKEEQLSRWLQLLKGKGTDAYGDIFDGLKVTYVRPLSSLSDSTLIEELLNYAEIANAELVIIDSLTIGPGRRC